jgi:hypothetical protein
MVTAPIAESSRWRNASSGFKAAVGFSTLARRPAVAGVFPVSPGMEQRVPYIIEKRIIDDLQIHRKSVMKRKWNAREYSAFKEWERRFDRPLWWMLVTTIGLPVAGVLLSAMTK